MATHRASYEMGGFQMSEPYPNTQIPLSSADSGFVSAGTAMCVGKVRLRFGREGL